MDKWASKRARLFFATSCSHPEIKIFARDVDFMDETDPFVCDCEKEWFVTAMFNLGFV